MSPTALLLSAPVVLFRTITRGAWPLTGAQLAGGDDIAWVLAGSLPVAVPLASSWTVPPEQFTPDLCDPHILAHPSSPP
ncbi:hypothetical protein [Streptacidiphilus carbonis]|uniref:hypothetical protein n=1 Tax=Streptacidiphilus carbonis TaxID=105422 RepID=UPI000A6B2D39|nr:hypothetical protein [Streptacidiphilus carbonis]